MRSLVADLTPPAALHAAQKIWRRAHGLGWHNFEGSWPTLADVPVTATAADDDPWAQTIGKAWRESFNFCAVATPTIDHTGRLILPLLVSQYSSPLTVLDFGGGPGIGLANILKYCRGLNLSRLSYVLIERAAMCRAVRNEIEAHSGTAIEEIPETLRHPLIVHAGASLHYVSDYKMTLTRLMQLKPESLIISNTPFTECPTYACKGFNAPHRTLAHWVFNRQELISEMEAHGFRLKFSVDHDLPLTYKNAPGPWALATMVFIPARPNQP